METVLLGFCLMSFTLSSVIVAVEITRDGIRHKDQKRYSSKKGSAGKKSRINKVSELSQKTKNKNASHPQKNVLDKLKQQLSDLGYVALEQQLGFVNWALSSHRKSLEEIKPQEFSYLFGVIQRYTTPAFQKHSQQAV